MGVRITILKSADQMDVYYVKQKDLEAYYSENQEFNGYWGGKTAEAFGLKGYITGEAFTRLSHNLNPQSGEQLTKRMQADRRPGFDVVFDVPKSVSLVHAHSKDDRILRLVRQSARDTMIEMEREAATRVRAGLEKNADKDRTTGNLCWAEFIHLTARPENGYSDPHLHIHMVVMNLTLDPEEKKWKALQMGEVHKEVPYFQAAFHRRVKEGLESLGLATVPTEKGFEIAGIPDDLIKKFSRRTSKIEAIAERLGITDPEQKARLGAMTREKKNPNQLITDLEPLWWGSLSMEHQAAFAGAETGLKQTLAQELSLQVVGSTSLERSAEVMGTLEWPLTTHEIGPSSGSFGKRKQLKAGPAAARQSRNQRTRPNQQPEKVHAATEHDHRALAMAAEHLFQRHSAVTEKHLLGEAFNHWEIDKATRSGIIQAMAEAPLLRKEEDGKVWVTTAEIVAEEERIIALCQQGAGKYEPLNRTWKISDERLNEGQRDAVLHALQSRDFVTGISGVAGSGKTTIMREIQRGIEAGFLRTVVLAPLAATARETLPKDGFKSAATIAQFMKSETLQKEARGGVLLVDEAGLISNPLGSRFLTLAATLDTRVRFFGDAGQHHAVERGQAFDLLQRKGDMQVANVTEILRQSGPYKEFVEMYVSGKTRRAVTSLWSMNAIVEQPLDELVKTLANDYVAALERGETALVVSPTHVEGDRITEAIREKLKEKGRLGKTHASERLRPLEWSEVQKSHPQSYRPGMTVQFNQRVQGFAPGQRVEVVDVRDDVVRLRHHTGNQPGIKPLPLNDVEKFEVYSRENLETMEWATLRNKGWTDAEKSDLEHYEVGLVVQINDHLKGYALGEQLEVIRVGDDSIRVRSRDTGKTKLLPLDSPTAFSVYERKTIEICEGDLLRITGNGYTSDGHRLTNGTAYSVDYIAPDGKLVLSNGWRIGPEFPHLTHGYFRTPQAAQGMTVDSVFACQTRELSAGATNQVQFHVATTRGRKGLICYMDNFEWLKDAVTDSPERLMATELLSAPSTERSMAQDDRLCALEAREFAFRPEIYAPNAPAYEPDLDMVAQADGQTVEAQEMAREPARELKPVERKQEVVELDREDDFVMEM